MSELETLREWHAFNVWNRRGYLECFAKLSPEQLQRDRGASYPTFLAIFAHSCRAYSIWIERAGRSNPQLPQVPPVPPLGPNPSLADVTRFEVEVQAQVGRFLQGLVEPDLGRTFHRSKSESIARDLELSVRDMLWHLVEEDLQHRGELNALLWQIDVDPPIVDWIDWVALPDHRPYRVDLRA